MQEDTEASEEYGAIRFDNAPAIDGKSAQKKRGTDTDRRRSQT